MAETEQTYRGIFENAIEGIYQSTPEGKFIIANPALARILGYASPDELIAVTTNIERQYYVAPERRAEFNRLIEELGSVQGFEVQMYRADGKLMWISESARAVRGPDGTLLYYEGAIEDVTARKQLEEEVFRLASIVESSNDAIIGKTLDGVITSWNQAAEKIYGFTAEEAIGQPVSILAPPDLTDELPEILEWISRGELVGHFETLRLTKQGKRINVSLSVSPVKGSDGRIVGASTIARDITERRRLEEQLLQSQKMEAIGRLSGGIAHDFNNLLTAIIGFSQILLGQLNPSDPMRNTVAEIEKAGQRAAILTSQLLAFSRKQVLQPKVLDLNVIVADMDRLLRRLIGEDIDVVTVLDPVLGRVKADPSQIEQTIVNLAVNARDAMPDGGRLTIETTNVYLDQTYASIHMEVTTGPYVLLAISDTGCGMDLHILSNIFEPFFTTKEKGRGTGLGLSTVFGIVKQSGGHISAYSEPGRGTTFKVYLPRVEGAAELAQDQSVPEVLKGTGTILVVEDDNTVRKLVRGVLQMNGYTVLEAANGGEALLICEQHPDPIHLMVTDVIMPRMTGRELADRLSELRPAMKVLYMSGYADNAIVHQGVLDEGTAFLQKPFTPEGLLSKVRDVLPKPK